MNVEEALAPRLRRRDDLSNDEWEVWEHRTWNMHRGVLHWRPRQDPAAWPEVELAVRERVAPVYRPSWWRGFAFGVVAELAQMPADAGRALDSLDTRNNRRGTWQWTILVSRDERLAVGLHTWMEGYLSEPFRSLLRRYQAAGLEVGLFTKDKDALMQFLTAVSRLRGVHWPEFRAE